MAHLKVAMSFTSGPAVKGLRDVDKATAKTTKGVAGLQAGLGKLGLAFSAIAIIRGLKTVTDLAAEQARTFAALEQGVKSTGGAAGFTASQLHEMANGLQAVTTFGNETIETGQAILLTFTNIRRDAFQRTTEVMLDLATAMGTDVRSAAVQLGKALNDPIKNLSAMSRAGIQFSEAQTELIKSLAETGRMAEAQSIILDELANQMGGRARAEAEAMGGGIKQLKENLLDLGKAIGGIILPVLDGMARAINVIVGQNLKDFNELLERLGLAAKSTLKEIHVFRQDGVDPLGVSASLAADDMDAATEEMEKLAKAAQDAARRELKEFHDRLRDLHAEFLNIQEGGRVAREAIASLATFDGLQELPTTDTLVEPLKEAVVTGIEQGTEEARIKIQNAAREWAEFVRASFLGMMSGIANAISTAIQKAWFEGFNRDDLRQMLTQIGGEVGAHFGRVLGYAMAGPLGMILGEALGGALGSIVGDLVSDVLDSISGGNDTAVGTLNFGPGGGSATSSTFGQSALVEAMNHMTVLLAQLERLTRGSIELTRQVAIHMDENGSIWVDILDLQGNLIGSLGEFSTLAEAAEAALVHLVNTANFSEDMRQAYQEILASASDINQMFDDLRFVSTLARELDRIGGPAMRARAAILDVGRQFDQMRAQINALGLSAEAAAPLLQQVAQAERARMHELRVDVLANLAAMAERFGANARLSVKVAVLQARIWFKQTKVQLQVLGMWERWGGLVKEVFDLMLQDARTGGGDGFQHGTPFRDFGPGTPTTLHGMETVVTAKQGESLASMFARAAASGGAGSPALLAKIDEQNALLRRLDERLRKQQTILPSLARHAALTRV